MGEGDERVRRDGPLRVAALVKQVPVAEDLELGDEGRLRRDGIPLEMNPYCRRAVSKGVELAAASGGECVVFTLGAPRASEVLREAVACGASRAVHVCDPAFAGSDTLATARALSAALEREGQFDLVLAGRNTTDGDTGQVAPEIAQLLDMPFACGVRELSLEGRELRLRLELEDGSAIVELSLPAVLSVAERLCAPCKAGSDEWATVPDDRIRVVTAADLGDGPWGEAGSPTVVGAVRVLPDHRQRVVLFGDASVQVSDAVRVLRRCGALSPPAPMRLEVSPGRAAGPTGSIAGRPAGGDGLAAVAVVVEPGRTVVAAELLGAARRLMGEIGGRVVAWRSTGTSGELPDLGALGADEVFDLAADGAEALAAEDIADALASWAAGAPPWAVLAPSTTFGREVAARTAASLGAGLIGDAVGLEVVDGRLVAAKPAFSGALVADITCTSPVQVATVRPGVLAVPAIPALPARRGAHVRRSVRKVVPRGRVRTTAADRDDDVEVLARAGVVVGVGTGVTPDEYPLLEPLCSLLGAELAATRKVTDRGWLPRSRQVGLTGRSIGPRLFVALGSSGKFNHMVGVRSAGTILAVNADRTAPVFDHADVGIVADWHEAVPLLVSELAAVLAERRVPEATRLTPDQASNPPGSNTTVPSTIVAETVRSGSSTTRSAGAPGSSLPGRGVPTSRGSAT